MTWPQKGMTVTAAGMLLGLGMCGVDGLMKHQTGVIDRTLPLLGAATVMMCAVLLVLFSLAWLALRVVEQRKRRRG